VEELMGKVLPTSNGSMTPPPPEEEDGKENENTNTPVPSSTPDPNGSLLLQTYFLNRKIHPGIRIERKVLSPVRLYNLLASMFHI